MGGLAAPKAEFLVVCDETVKTASSAVLRYFTHPVAVKLRIAAAGVSTRDTRSFARIRRLIKGLVPDSLWEQETSTPMALLKIGQRRGRDLCSS
jgi:hypothetical protein